MRHDTHGLCVDLPRMAAPSSADVVNDRLVSPPRAAGKGTGGLAR